MTEDSHLPDEISRHLQQWGRRRLCVDALLWLPRGLLAGLVAAAAVAAIARLRPSLYNREVAVAALALAVLGLLVSSTILFLRNQSVLEQARFFDRQFELRERMSTAVEISTGRLSTTPALAEHQLADTVEVASQIHVNSELPLRINQLDLMMLVVATLLLALAVIMPNQQSSVLAEQEALTQAIEEQVVALQAMEEQIQNAPLAGDIEREELLEPIRKAYNELNTEGLSREEAVAVLSEAEADLRELAESGNADAIKQALLDAGQPLTDNPSAATMGQRLSSGELGQAAQAANQLADDLAQLSSDESAALAYDLQEAAQALADIDSGLAAQLSESAEGLQDGDLQRAQQALHEASATMQQRALEQAAAEQAQAAADSLQSGRQEVATSGSPADRSSAGDSPSQNLANGDGQGSQDGNSSGQVTQTTGDDQGTGQAGLTSSEKGQGVGGPGPGGGHSETVYVPGPVDLSADEGAKIELPAECIVAPENCGSLINESATDFRDEQSLVPYETVFGDYRDAAFEALEGDYVPLGMKSVVRDYFSSLEP